ncbi:MAP3K-like protein kinase [Citrus sinensis]|uniref:MAP3K-like protein kinase n=1 Tax=Citrus sinensis TaxID=2711 RepID=A0ACB8LFZ4_CITSI|nr:MAP3K-like protein kinase [Citrus sinensis]
MQESKGSRCVRSSFTDQFKLENDSLHFSKYAFLTTHNSFAISGEPPHTRFPRVTLTNQEDTVTQQLNVRGHMVVYSFDGKCLDITAFEPARDTFKEIEAFLSANPTEIVTIILEDYVETPNGLTKVFNESGLMKYWFPVSKMPQNGQDRPLVKDMVASNQRLIVFTSKKSKQESEGVAYQWNYMATDGLTFLLSTFTKYETRSNGGRAFQAVDTLNGKLLCGCNDVHACVHGSAPGSCSDEGDKD